MEHDSSASDVRGQRSLAAIVFTDGVGFSARMSADEELTLDLIRRDLQLMRELCWKFDGRVLKSTGDGLLMSFVSAISAVACSLEIQQAIAEAAALLPPEQVLMHRIGVHLGDVFISETDVMGTGVNIAARLQTTAEPGGICVSQTVYDVVKTGLDLKAIYLGPQSLKNIKQPIPVYRISAATAEEPWATSGDTEMTVATTAGGNSSVTHFTPPTDRYDSITRTLEQHDNALRIKKLLYCLCRNQWATNIQQLNSASVRNLIELAHQNFGTASQLKVRLDSIVKSISKPAEYSPLSAAIVTAMGPLYQDDPEPPRFLYQEVAQILERDRNQMRIKKLLVCLCRDTWENNPQTLEQYPLVDLLQELVSIAPTIHHLQMGLSNIVKTLNKQAEYELVAQMILQQVGRLYPNYQEVPTIATPAAPPAPPVPSVLSAPPAPPPQRQALFRDLAASHPVAVVPVPVPVPTLEPEPAPEAEPEPAAAETVQIPEHLFDIRLEIFRYTNPLVAKLVLFSTLHQKLPFTQQSWAILKMHPLDELLQELFTTFPTLEELETQLYNTAKLMEEPEQCSQAASAILQALRPLFHASGSSLSTLLQQNRSTPATDTDAATQMNWSGFGDDDAATCQFLVAPKITQDLSESTCQLEPPPNPRHD